MGSAVQIQTIKKRAFLNQALQGALANTMPLGQALLAIQQGVYSPTFAKGRIVVSQSGSGQAGTFQISSFGSEWTQDNIFALTQELIELIAYCQADGSFTGADDGTPAQLNALYAAMVNEDQLAGLTSQQGDWTSLNIPSLGGIPGAA